MVALWHTDTDRIEEGQWMKARLYERRADLSPDGTKLLYFAAQWRNEKMPTWTAISTPPWLTAHVLWPKGDAWGGGGLFESNKAVALNHPYGDMKVHATSKVPAKLRIRELGMFGRGGEDFPLYGMRLERDGWRLVSQGGAQAADFTGSPAWRYDPAVEYARARPLERGVELRMRILGMHETKGAGDWYAIEHCVVRTKSGEADELLLDLGRAEWADWDRTGDLLFARDGVLSRLRRKDGLDIEKAREVIDLRDRKFEARVSPPHARNWRWRT